MSDPQAEELAQVDIETTLAQPLPPDGEGFVVEFSSPLDEPGRSVVQWRYEGRTPDDGFLGLGVPDTALAVHGVSLLDLRGEEPQFQRYIDWMGVYTQLGLSLSWRQPIEVPEG